MVLPTFSLADITLRWTTPFRIRYFTVPEGLERFFQPESVNLVPPAVTVPVKVLLPVIDSLPDLCTKELSFAAFTAISELPSNLVPLIETALASLPAVDALAIVSESITT